MGKSVAVKKVYDEGYARMSDLAGTRLDAVNRLAREFTPPSTERLLDIGCGDGEYTNTLARITGATELHAIDIAQKAVDAAKKHGVRAVRLDVDEADLPYASEYFDFIFCGNLLELILNADHLLSEMRRVLKKDGVIIVSFPNISAWMSRIAVLLGFLPYYARVSTKYDMGKFMSKTTKGGSTGFIRLMNLRVFRELSGLCGLAVVKAVGMTEPALPAPLRPLDLLFSKNPNTAFQLVCVLQKS